MTDKPGTTVRTDVDGAVAEIVLDGPAIRNAVDERALGELAAAARDLAAACGDGAIRAVILRGEGKVFCAGRDISGVDPDADDALAYLQGAVVPAIEALRSIPVPTFALVQGAALGVGFGLAAAADVIYAGERARFGSPFAAIGALPDSGAHAFFLDRLGPHRTLDLIYTGDLIDGVEAAALGLVARAVPDEDLLEVGRRTAMKVAAGPTAAFAASKRIVAGQLEARMWLSQVTAEESEAQERLRGTSPDYREGFAAFQSKRPPTFTGR